MKTMKNYRITVNGVSYDVTVEETAAAVTQPAPVPSAAPAVTSAPAPKATPAPAAAPAVAADGQKVLSPMPGTILSVNVSVGSAVKAGEVILILEAMKMETPVKAPQDGVVATVDVAKGESVDSGKTLVTLN